MKPLLLLASLSLTVCAVLHGAEPTDSAKEQVANLLTDIPEYRLFTAYLEVARTNDAPDPLRVPEIPPTAKEVEKAKAILKRATVARAKLREVLTVGKSVFDYPGLLTRGSMSHSQSLPIIPGLGESPDDYYILTLGVPSVREGKTPDYYKVYFDGRGIITKIENIDLRH